ncbi:diguanylate cyclase [Lachnospiraceae bacterium OttesenSCG-928-D06]|nr:diguanylate cyclase [Lachnospiraceae bacterium OttesenSCG-928-D06]
MKKEKALILIVDDQEMNRALLSDMLEDDYRIMEAADGLEAIGVMESKTTQIACILLDVRMPNMDGFEVLTRMKRDRLLEQIPVIMISNDDSAKSVEKSYSLGAADYINRPFNNYIVKKRVENTIFLYQKTKTLTELVAEQVAEKEKNNANMITVLSAIVEFRNGESGTHTLKIRIITEILLECIMRKYPEYELNYSTIADMSNAAALHDIGKITIPEEILNKPGKFTDEEFAVMKTHSAVGADMLDKMHDLVKYNNMFEYARQICRWHHERWDGRGYPDGLVAEQIPLCAQVVALADVYDALTSERVYKPPFTHDNALNMIYNGECGQFNPQLLDALREVSGTLQEKIQQNSQHQDKLFDTQEISNEILVKKDVVSERTISLIEEERTKYQFLAALSNEIIIDYDVLTDIITFSEKGYTELGLPLTIEKFSENMDRIGLISVEEVKELFDKVAATTSVMPVIRAQYEIILKNGESAWFEVILRSMWSRDIVPQIKTVIGKILNINEQKTELQRLENLAARDTLTHLYNRISAQRMIERFLKSASSKMGIYIFMDIDHFKELNDTKGHTFGDEVLCQVADIISSNIRTDDVAARIGGDEFIIFMKDIENNAIALKQADRIHKAFINGLKDKNVTVSMGVSIYPVDGTGFAELTDFADKALYEAKSKGRNQYAFYSKIEA